MIHENGAAPTTPPAIFLTGGPGETASTPFVRGNLTFTGTPRTFVVLDQRGTGRSTPRLDCPEFAAPLDSTHPWKERVAHEVAAARTCRSRLLRDGIDLDGYNTVENAADVVALRHALDIPRWVVGGISYGGRLAQEVYRQDPGGVNALVLDSSILATPLGPAALVSGAEAAIARIDAACDAQPTCTATNGDLRRNLDLAAANLTASPHVVPAGGGLPSLTIDGSQLLAGFFQAMYDTDTIPLLPPGLSAVARGNTAILDTLAARIRPTPSTDPRDDPARGMADVTLCADDGGAMTPRDRAVLANPGSWSSLLIGWPWLECGAWNVDPLPKGSLGPASGDVPTLITSGSLDPIAPTTFALRIGATLPRATLVDYPGGGHGVLDMNECATRIANAFYDDPTSTLDTSCVSSMPLPFAP